MENPASWGPLEKAVSAAATEFYKHFAICEGPDPIDLKASDMARTLIDQGVFKMEDEMVLKETIEAALKMRLANPMPMISEVKQIADALRAAGLGG